MWRGQAGIGEWMAKRKQNELKMIIQHINQHIDTQTHTDR